MDGKNKMMILFVNSLSCLFNIKMKRSSAQYKCVFQLLVREDFPVWKQPLSYSWELFKIVFVSWLTDPGISYEKA